MLHPGTLTGVFAVYLKDIANIIIKSIFGKDRAEGPYPQESRMLWLVILATIPTAVIGLAFRSFFEYSFYDPLSIGTGFIITGVFLLITLFLKAGSKKLGPTDAVLIGVGRAFDIFKHIEEQRAHCHRNVQRH